MPESFYILTGRNFSTANFCALVYSLRPAFLSYFNLIRPMEGSLLSDCVFWMWFGDIRGNLTLSEVFSPVPAFESRWPPIEKFCTVLCWVMFLADGNWLLSMCFIWAFYRYMAWFTGLLKSLCEGVMLRSSLPKLARRAAIARCGAALLLVKGASPPVGMGLGE